jgi:hypothetical protein
MYAWKYHNETPHFVQLTHVNKKYMNHLGPLKMRISKYSAQVSVFSKPSLIPNV